ncbi:MAG TPA: hypothetical protein VHZ28_05110 [Terracidiphilus sp.]|jgi:hypothetical protein|nr:hypothetical protein [Terracidiphilus sp.]
MILGMSLSAFTTLHGVISLIAIAAGFLCLFGLLAPRRLPLLNAVFLTLTALTSITGFFFPFKGVTPGIVLGILSLIVLALAATARYVGHMAGAWRGTYVISAGVALYFNVFVLIAQSFQKVPALHALAPTQTETPFKIAQLATLILLIALTVLAFRRYRPLPATA